MTNRTVTKSLIVQEDFALGQGQSTQTRQGVTTTVNLIDLPWVLTTLAEIRRLDTTKYKHCMYSVNNELRVYLYNSSSAETVDNYDYVAPNEGAGQWVLQQVLGTINSANVTYAPTGGTSRSVESKLQETISVKDYSDLVVAGDWTAAIQAAIDAAAAYPNGSTVIIPVLESPYLFTAIVNKTNVCLKSTGGVLKLADNVAVNAGTNYYPIGNLTGTNVGYEDLIVLGNSANNTLYNACDLITCSGEGSYVKNCRLFDAPDSAIMFTNATQGQCVGNFIQGTKDAGIYVNADEGSNNLEGAIINSNVIQDSDYGGVNIKRGTRNIVVDGNSIENCGNGITVEDFGVATGGNPEDLTITNNLLRDIGWNFRSLSPAPSEVGISAQFARNSIISGNKFVNVSGAVVELSGVKDSTITANNLQGYPSDPKTSSFGNVGIILLNRTKATGTHNGAGNSSTLTDTTQDFIPNDLVGMTVNNTTDGSSGTITSNTATTVTATLSGGTDNDWDASDAYTIVSTPEGNTISSNIIRNLEDEGIYLVNAHSNIISANVVKDVDKAVAGNQAFRADADTQDNIIALNIFHGPTNDAAINASASDNIFYLNKLPNATGVGINGFTRNTGFTTPVGNITPVYSGQVISTTSGGQKFWQSYGLTNADWLQIG